MGRDERRGPQNWLVILLQIQTQSPDPPSVHVPLPPWLPGWVSQEACGGGGGGWGVGVSAGFGMALGTGVLPEHSWHPV